MRTNARQELKRPLRSMKALDRVAEVYQIQPGHRRMQAAYLYSLFTGTSVKLGSTLRYPRPSMTHGWPRYGGNSSAAVLGSKTCCRSSETVGQVFGREQSRSDRTEYAKMGLPLNEIAGVGL
jgi:hypothetical protein